MHEQVITECGDIGQTLKQTVITQDHNYLWLRESKLGSTVADVFYCRNCLDMRKIPRS